MPDERAQLIWTFPAAGLALVALGWLAIVALASGSDRLDLLQARLDAARPVHTGSPRNTPLSPLLVSQLLQRPMIALSGQGPLAEPAVQLQGVAVTSAGGRALLLIGSTSAVWLQLGENRMGVTLRRVEPTRVVIDTLSGEHDLGLGGKLAPPQASMALPQAGAAPGTFKPTISP